MKNIQTNPQKCFSFPRCSIQTVKKKESVLFHSNFAHIPKKKTVYNDGSICLDILQNKWSPIFDISAILTSIRSLLSDPNPDSPANAEAARLFIENKREYNKKVQETVELSWEGDDEEDGEDGEDGEKEDM